MAADERSFTCSGARQTMRLALRHAARRSDGEAAPARECQTVASATMLRRAAALARLRHMLMNLPWRKPCCITFELSGPPPDWRLGREAEDKPESLAAQVPSRWRSARAKG